MSIRLRLLVVLLLLHLFTSAQAAEDPEDAAVGKAVRAALLGDAQEIHALAAEQRAKEQEAPDSDTPTLSENLKSLAIAVERPLADLDEKQEALHGFPKDQTTANLDRLIRRVEPRQQFLEARKDRRYEDWRRVFNGFSGPVTSLAQGQFFPLFALPFNALDYLFIGHRYLTPEGRRELFTARAVALYPEPDPIARDAQEVLKDWTPRRRRLAALQAEENGKRAHEREDWQSADFWFRREVELREWPKAQRKEHLDTAVHRARESAQQRNSLVVIDGDSQFYSPSEFAVYTQILRGLVLDESDRVSTWTRELLVDFPQSEVCDDAQAARAAALHRDGQDYLAHSYLLEASRDDNPSQWRSWSAFFLERPEFSPEVDLKKAEGIAAARFRNYLVFGEDPAQFDRQLSAEEARAARQSIIYRAQGLFITDIIARTISLPFVLPFPKPELLDAAARLDPSWFRTPTGRIWLECVMKEQAGERRYADAARTARQLGDTERAFGYERKAAKRLERLADDASPREAALIYERVLNAYPAYRQAPRVEDKLKQAQLDTNTVLRIDRDELRAYPEVWSDEGLHLDPRLLDGSRSDGEVTDDGVAILYQSAYVYTDKATGRSIEVPMEDEDHMAVLRMMESRRRMQALREELAKPLPRRKVPIEIEAGVFPGFDVQPGLVPLQPNPEVRVLYE